MAKSAEERRRFAAIRRREKHRSVRDELFRLLGATCKRCGFDDARALQIDHVNSDGRDERSRHGGSHQSRMLDNVRAGSDAYQVLCANCNVIKVSEANERVARKHEGDAIPQPLRPCGTHAAYHRGCRCQACVVAHRAYCSDKMRKRYRPKGKTNATTQGAAALS